MLKDAIFQGKITTFCKKLSEEKKKRRRKGESEILNESELM